MFGKNYLNAAESNFKKFHHHEKLKKKNFFEALEIQSLLALYSFTY